MTVKYDARYTYSIVSVGCWASPALTEGKEQEVALGQWGRESRMAPLMIPEHLDRTAYKCKHYCKAANVPVYACITAHAPTSFSFSLSFFSPSLSPFRLSCFYWKRNNGITRMWEFAKESTTGREASIRRSSTQSVFLLLPVEASGYRPRLWWDVIPTFHFAQQGIMESLRCERSWLYRW